MSNAARGTGWSETYLGGSKLEETRRIHSFVETINIVQERLRLSDRRKRAGRGFNAKAHAAIANAVFVVADEIPEELRRGVFQPGARYEGVAIRFSNSSGLVQADAKPDLRGMAIRAPYGDESAPDGSAVQDFLGTNYEVNHARDADEFMRIAQAMTDPFKFARLLFPSNWALLWRSLMQRYSREVMRRPVASLTEETFWSRAPFAIGPVAVRFRIAPSGNRGEVGQHRGDPGEARQDADYLRDDLVSRLRAGDVEYRFEIQRFNNERETPIEDGAVPWTTPFETLATIVLPQQDLTTEEALADHRVVEAMEFSPWHASDDFRPLGSLNRARRLVYDASADLRNGRRGQELPPRAEVVSETLFRGIFAVINRFLPWHRITWPKFLGLANLRSLRVSARQKDLHDLPVSFPGEGTRPEPRRFGPSDLNRRSCDGRGNDPTDLEMGRAGARFGRNVPLSSGLPDPASLLDPSPREISRELLQRTHFQPVEGLNMLAAAWIQFQVHGWFAHETQDFDALDPKSPEDKDKFIEVPLADGDSWHARPMKVLRTPEDTRPGLGPNLPPAYRNTESHWWDASQIYGSSQSRQDAVREHSGGRLRLDENGLLPEDESTRGRDPDTEGVDLAGFNDNYWLGLSLMHTLFAREHNSICEALSSEYPAMAEDDEALFQHARLINAALIAKIHTLEWSAQILPHPLTAMGFNTYWWGLARLNSARWLRLLCNHEVWTGIPGSATSHHGVPYSMTEEFVSVYRMHPLLADEYDFMRLGGEDLGNRTLTEITGEHTRSEMRTISLQDGLYSFGLMHPGTITLHNYPNELRRFRRIKKGQREQIVDVATIDIVRDRERGVPRYIDFRKQIRMPVADTFEGMAEKEIWERGTAMELKAFYRDRLDRVDAMVGMFAEVLPRGFGFSETAFRVFIVMASRRLQSDRFFTTYYTPEVYTPLGIDWIERNTLKSVIGRHCPNLVSTLEGVGAFTPWR
jgi:hypothetical protein